MRNTIRLGALILLGLFFGWTPSIFAQTTLSSTSISFGNQATGITSAAKTVTLKNTQTSALTISSIAISEGTAPSDYAPGGNCPISPSTLAAGSSCTISVTFRPSALGSRTATLTITHSATNSPQTVTVSGTGINPITPSSSPLAFGNQAQGTTSATKTETLKNAQTTPLTISAVSVNGDFAQAGGTCAPFPRTLAAGGSCTVLATFSPTTTAPETGALTTFDDNPIISQQAVSLTGTGIVPVTLSTSSIDFGSLALGSTSATKSVSVTNHKNVSLNFSSIATTGDFAISSNTCGTSVATGASCTVRTTFSPVALGARSGSLTFMDDATNSPQVVSLTGTGTGPVSLSTSSLSFGTIAIGNTGTSQSVKLTNLKSSSLNFSIITVSANFKVASNTCGSKINSGASCTVGVTFAPTSLGAIAGSLTFNDDAVGSPQTVSLAGTGTDATPPKVSITAPFNGASLTGSVIVTANASDNVGVTAVQFLLDGSALGAPVTTSPYLVVWNTTLGSNGAHTLAAKASDAAGNTATSAPIAVTVANIAPSTPGNLTGTVLSISKIQLNWTVSSSSNGVAGYRVTRDGVLLGSTTALTYPDTGLAASTTYSYTVSAFDALGNVSAPASVSVTTPAASNFPPLISGVSSTNATSVGVTIVWTTDEIANSQVQYGQTLPYGQSSDLNPALTNSHSVTLTGLTALTFYHFAVQSTDASGNLAVSDDYTFTTTDVPIISLVNDSESVSCGNATTCSVALKAPVAQSNFLVITAWAINPVHAVSIGSGGTFVDGNVRNGTQDTRGFLSGGYVSSATATNGPIVVTFSGATGGAQVNIREYSVSGDNLVLDATGDVLSTPTPNPIAAPTLTLTGTNDLIVSWAGASTRIASVAWPYGNADIANDETGTGTADLLNTTVGTPPSWSAVDPATTAASASMAFGFQPQPCSNMALMDATGGIAGSVITPAALNASTLGAVGTGNTRDNWSWAIVNTSSAFTWSAAAHHPLVSGVRSCSGGATYVDGSSLGVEYNTSKGSGQYAQMFFPGTWYETQPFVSNTASAGIWFYTSLPQSASVNADIFTLYGSDGGFINVILFGTGTNLVLQCELSQARCNPTEPVIQSNKWYWLTLQYNNGGTHYGAVYDDSLNLLGSFSGKDTTASPPGYVFFGHSNVYSLTPNAVLRFDKLKVCYIGNCYFPVLP